MITHKDFAAMEKGLIQRVDALNLFLADIYSDGKIVKDGVVPEDFVYISKGYLRFPTTPRKLDLSKFPRLAIEYGFRHFADFPDLDIQLDSNEKSVWDILHDA